MWYRAKRYNVGLTGVQKGREGIVREKKEEMMAKNISDSWKTFTHSSRKLRKPCKCIIYNTKTAKFLGHIYLLNCWKKKILKIVLWKKKKKQQENKTVKRPETGRKWNVLLAAVKVWFLCLLKIPFKDEKDCSQTIPKEMPFLHRANLRYFVSKPAKIKF